MTKSPTISQFNKQFPDDNACLDHLMRIKYGERFDCPKCDREARYYRVASRRCYECEHCGNQVYPTAGTPFERTRTSLKDWFYVMFLFCASRNGVSAKEIQRQIGVTYKTAWRMGHEIRKYMGWVDGEGPLGGQGRNPVEIDKAFIGGRDKQGEDDKAIVLGMVERGGEIITRVISDRREVTVAREIITSVSYGARVATDEAKAFQNLREYGYAHATVNHSAKEYVRGEVHTNTIEGFWSVLKRGLSGTHVWVSPKHLSKYLGEFEYRHNLRGQPHVMFDLLLMAFQRPATGASSTLHREGDQIFA